MKKTIGTILAVLCLAAALLLGSGTAFAQTAGQWTPREHPQDTIGCVNGAQSDEIIAQADRDLGGCKFTYRGKGKLTGWEVPLLEEGKDYKILSQSGRSITIAALDEEGCLPYINAKVQQPSAVASTSAVTTSGVAAVPPATKRETEAQAQMRTEKQTEKAPQMEAGSTKAATEAVDGEKESTAKGSRPVLPLAALGACALAAVALVLWQRKRRR